MDNAISDLLFTLSIGSNEIILRRLTEIPYCKMSELGNHSETARNVYLSLVPLAGPQLRVTVIM